MKRRTIIAAGSLALTAISPKRGHADLFGGDVAELALILAELLVQGKTLFDQLARLKDQVEYSKQTLERLDPTSFSGVLRAYNDTRGLYDQMMFDVRTISYRTNQVDADFRRLFPRKQSDWRAVSSPDFNRRYSAWNEDLTDSTLVAMRAQTQMSRIHEMNEAAARALQASQAAAGEVRQLQATNQMLSVIQQQLSSLIQLLATGSRVTSEMAAASSGEKMMIRESKRRRREGYTSRGKPPKRLTHLP